MKVLGYQIDGVKITDRNYRQIKIPENVISLEAVRKENGIFLQYVTEDNRKEQWAQAILNRNYTKIKEITSDRKLGVTFVRLRNGERGFSRCSTKDDFNVVVGRAVAICHATGEKIPDFV